MFRVFPRGIFFPSLPGVAGKYSNVLGQDSCLAAPIGTSVPTTGLTAPVGCLPGNFQDKIGQTACKPCLAGAYAPLIGMDECLPCQIGFYAPVTGLSSCVGCPPGQFEPIPAASAWYFLLLSL